MTTSTLGRSVSHRTLTVAVDYGCADVERAAETLDIFLSDAEIEAVLEDVDNELPQLASAATRSALAARIYDDLRRVARGHAWSDDD